MRATKLIERLRMRREGRQNRDGVPVTATFGALLTTILFTGIGCTIVGIHAGSVFSLNLDGLARLEAWRIVTFLLSCFVPASSSIEPTSASVFASALIYCVCIASLAVGGPVSERRLGTWHTIGVFSVAAALQAAFTLVIFGLEHAYSPVGPVLALLVFAVIVEFERNSPKTEADMDLRLVVLAFLVLVVSVSAAFDMAFRPLLPGLLAGPVVAVSAFAFKRKSERERVHRDGSGQVGTLYYAEETELLTMEELKAETDRLLEKIATEGYQSLTPQQRAYLSRASVRLKSVKPPSNGGPNSGREE